MLTLTKVSEVQVLSSGFGLEKLLFSTKKVQGAGSSPCAGLWDTFAFETRGGGNAAVIICVLTPLTSCVISLCLIIWSSSLTVRILNKS